MATTVKVDPVIEDELEREKAELLQRAKEKPTLQMINAERPLTIEKWQELYPELALFIEVTKEDFSKIYEGKLIATAENPIEFLDLRQDFRSRNIVNLTAYGNPIGDQPILLPPIFYFGTPLVD
jgi:hypothetical protein